MTVAPESPERLAKVRAMIERFVVGIIYMEKTAGPISLDEKVDSVRIGLEMMNVPWDPTERPLWAEIIEYAEGGGELTDDYLIDWRRRYRKVLGNG